VVEVCNNIAWISLFNFIDIVYDATLLFCRVPTCT
jgi:hypothetical protein